MMWPDIVLGVGGFLLSVALLPTVFSKYPPHRVTCLFTGIILLSFSAAMIETELFLGATALIIQSSIWFYLLMKER